MPAGALVEEAVSGLSLDQAGVERAASGRSLLGAEGRVVEFHDTLPSTNDRAKALAREGAAEGSLVVAAQQADGRGRLGRKWSSPVGGLYLSLLTPLLCEVLGRERRVRDISRSSRTSKAQTRSNVANRSE